MNSALQLRPDIQEPLVSALLGLKTSEVPVHIPGGLSQFSMSEWRELLLKKCGFEEDRRHFGFDKELNLADWWEISYQPDKATSYAYSNTRQPLHTDNAWFQDPAEINFFVMYKQAHSGGEQNVLPLSRLIDQMHSDAPELLNDLANYPVVIKKGDGEYHNNTTIIHTGDDPRIYWNYYRTQRTSREVDDMCEAFFSLLDRYESTNLVEMLHCQSGDCFAFNDTKLLHGRAAFTANVAKDRVLFQSMWKPLCLSSLNSPYVES